MKNPTDINASWLLIPIFLVIWSSAFAVARLALEHMAPMSMLSLRFVIATLIAALIAWLRREDLPAWRDVIALALIGVVNHTTYLGLSYIGMREVPAGLTAVIISANPVLTTVLAAALLHERIRSRQIIGLLLGVMGVLMILQHRVTIGAEHWSDLAWPLGALAALSGGTILFARLGRPGAGFAGLAVQLAAAAIVAIIVAALFEDRPSFIGLPGIFWLSMTFQAGVASVGAYAIWFHLVQRAGASRASAWHFLIPPLGILFGVLILNETVVWVDLVGIVPVVIGIWLVNRPTRNASRKPIRTEHVPLPAEEVAPRPPGQGARRSSLLPGKKSPTR